MIKNVLLIVLVLIVLAVVAVIGLLALMNKETETIASILNQKVKLKRNIQRLTHTMFLMRN